MAHLGDLKKVKLKKVFREETESKVIQNLCSSSEDYQKLMAETYIEEYFSLIKQISFSCSFLDFPKSAAQVLVQLYGKFAEGIDEIPDNFKEFKELQTIVQDINKIIKQNEWNSIFIRLSSRSPKDAGLTLSCFNKTLEDELVSVISEEKELLEYLEEQNIKSVVPSTELNRKLFALHRASIRVLKCSSGQEALELLCKSARIQDDLRSYSENKLLKPLCLCVREYKGIDFDLEFRGFVYNNRLTALTQYNELCYFPWISNSQHTEAILNDIKNKFELFIKPALQGSLSNYVLDFAFSLKSSSKLNFETSRKIERFGVSKINDTFTFRELEVFVVEINPLAEFAGSGLFDWIKDKPILLGEKPFEFRFHKKNDLANTLKQKQCLSNLPEAWRKWVE